MSPPQNKITKNSLPLAINYVLFSLMMALFSVVIVSFGQALAPSWNASYLIGAAFIISLETLLSKRIVSNRAPLSREWILQYLTEAVLIFISLKICVIISRWLAGQSQPAEFIDGDFMFSLVYAGLIWMITSAFGQMFTQLEENPETMEQQKAGQIASDMEVTRRRMISWIFGIGALMLAIYTLMHLDIRQVIGIKSQLENSPWPIIAYFVIGLVVISQTRYASLRIRWFMDNVAVGPHVGPRWLIYGLIMFIFIGALSLLLPTRYSYGLFATLQALIEFIISFVMSIFVLLTIPFGVVLGWLQSLLGAPPEVHTPSPPPLTIRQPPTSGQPMSVPEWIQSMAFWGVLLVITIFSLIYYIRSHKEYRDYLSQSRFSTWWTGFWDWLRISLRRMNKRVTKAINVGILRLTKRGPQKVFSAIRAPFTNRQLENRLLIRQVYLQFIQIASEQGYHRRDSFTPSEYASHLGKNLPDVQPEIQDITNNFSEARYTTHPVSKQLAQATVNILQKIVESLRKKQDSDSSLDNPQ